VKPDDWDEYNLGLIVYLLGALKFGNLDLMPEAPASLPKQVAFLGAATIATELSQSKPTTLDGWRDEIMTSDAQIMPDKITPVDELKRLRAFLEATFHRNHELRTFCREYQINVFPELPDSPTPAVFIEILIDYCDRHSILNHLKQCLAAERPYKYDDFFNKD
jgi:hypothetical protein